VILAAPFRNNSAEHNETARMINELFVRPLTGLLSTFRQGFNEVKVTNETDHEKNGTRAQENIAGAQWILSNTDLPEAQAPAHAKI